MFQSTHPHEVRPLLSGGLFTQAIVSIHAPTRGATILFQSLYRRKRFQSTHPHEVRPYIAIQLDNIQTIVSIHAPTRGATILKSDIDMTREVSIHAPTRGATISILYYHAKGKFQSTHPHEVRREKGH